MTKKKNTPAPPAFDVWPIGIKDAASYCGMTEAAIKYHIYVSKDLKPRLVGHSFLFERDVLDQFLAQKRKPGRPTLEPDTAATA